MRAERENWPAFLSSTSFASIVLLVPIQFDSIGLQRHQRIRTNFFEGKGGENGRGERAELERLSQSMLM